MDKRTLVLQIVEALRRTVVHYGLWFAETDHQLGTANALKAESMAGDRLFPLAMDRICCVLGMEMEDGLPAPLLALDVEQLEALLKAMSINWLAADGVWFQAVERLASMHDAKRANDTCWTRFSPLEAWRIKQLLELPDKGGLEALETAFEHRLYSRINKQEIVDRASDGFTFRMTECRVQRARERKGLEPYPCGSGGLVEYREFARTIDPRIQVECLAAPPESRVGEGAGPFYCAWRFTLRPDSDKA